MARHLMAVCVVCLLCAEHLPCKEHFESKSLNKNLIETIDNIYDNELLENSYNKVIKTNFNNYDTIRIDYQYTKRKGRTKEHSQLLREKRHADHHHHNIINKEDETSKVFLKKLFLQFGDADGKSMNVLGFEKMLKQLGLYNMIEEKLPKDASIHRSSKISNKTCISSVELISRISPDAFQPITDHQSEKINKTIHSENSNDTKTQIEYNELKKNMIIDSSDLSNICPILLYQLAAPTSSERSGCIHTKFISQKINLKQHTFVEDRFYVWVYAIVSVLGVSLVGLLGVAVIPCMDRHFYQHIIQFLVALAVGTLAGDALLHLLPHSMITFSSDTDSHSSMIWKGLISVLGVIFFFATERGLTMISEWRKKIEKKEKPSSRVRVMRDPDSTSVNNSATGDKLCKHKYSSYPYCYDEIAMDTKDDHHHHHHQDSLQKKIEKPTNSVSNNKNVNHTYSNSNDHGDHNETAQSLLPHNYTISDNYSVINKEDSNNPDNNTISTNWDEGSIEGAKDKPVVRDETYTIILREHESTHHGHSHKHGHVHSPPRSLSAVAWMVVMGDGLHNFTDGMAIGAAFSNNIAGGFSTAIAVFCHELPHELGDFAVLLKAGMSAKQAVYYNLLSSVLSFFGMVLGVLIGDTPEASAYIFACAAGMFIYIALVDMMPELTSTHNERCALSQCLLQLFGMSCGLGIMLLIALYEDDLKTLFSSNHSDHIHH